MKNLPCPAPTNQPNTCLLCGKNLRPEGNGAWRWLRLEEATPEQLEVWPLVHWYELDPATGKEVYQRSTYDTGARFENVKGPRGLSDYTGSWVRRTSRGDGCFCGKPCAVLFARAAANMGFRLPTHTAEERKAAQQHHQFLKQFAPYELESAPSESGEQNDVSDWKCRSRSKSCRITNWNRPGQGVTYEGPRQPKPSKRIRESGD